MLPYWCSARVWVWVGGKVSNGNRDNGENHELETSSGWVEAKEQRPYKCRGPVMFENWHLRLLTGWPTQCPGAAAVYSVQIAGPDRGPGSKERPTCE